jgi:ketosteroid isomerase-like protein
MKKQPIMKFSFLPLLLLISMYLPAQEPDSSSALFSLREAERNFARESVMIGRNAAFAKNFAEESILYTDRWITNGKQFSGERKAVPVVLKWEPEYIDISDSRDFGISTGPWEAQEYRPNTESVATGYYLTVWKKQSDGGWKVILDGGSTTPALKNPKHSFSFPAGADKSVPNPPAISAEKLTKELFDRENQFASEWGRNPIASTYKSFLTHETRLQLSGHLPTTNTDSLNVLIAGLDRKMIWKPVGAGAATSGDLGFTYGMLENTETPKAIKGHYVRIWRKTFNSSWKIIFEMMNFD